MKENFNMPKSLLNIIRDDWRWWTAGSIFSFFLASILISGWPNGIWPDLSFPYIYHGDGLSHSWATLRAIEGWIFDNPRSGYPFGSNFLDYPGSDSGNLIILKILGLITGKYYYALNIFILISFSVVFLTGFCTLRSLDLSKPLAFSAALLFSFLPFHFQRMGHLFYLWYFCVPIFFHICYTIYRSEELLDFKKIFSIKNFSIAFLLIALSSFGVYYALFGVLMLAVTGLTVYFRSMLLKSLLKPFAAIAIICIGVFINLSPNIIHKQINGANSEVAIRSPAEAEIYGLKLMQLILPRTEHRNEYLSTLISHYNKNYPLINENMTSSLGLVGAIGLMVAFLMLMTCMSSQRKLDPRLSLFGLLVIFLYFFGTIGGLGAVFSATISSSIRGWNRISIFIGFGTIAIFFFGLQYIIFRYFSAIRVNVILITSALLFGFIGLYDQTINPCITCNAQNKIAFEMDRKFIADIERSIPIGGAVYQLPYMAFPEVAPLNRLHTYDHTVGFLHSKEVKWSYAGMKGRQGDLFYRSLSQESIEKQIEVIRRLGFAGIYIDRRGYKDNAELLISQLTILLGSEPSFKREDGEVVFFKINSPTKEVLSNLSTLEIMQKAGYVVDKLGPRHYAKLSEGIDFTLRTWPEFIKDVNGISGPEPWGRWSDADAGGHVVRFTFNAKLPDSFSLVLQANAFGPNEGKAVKVKAGQVSQDWVIKNADPVGTYTLKFAKVDGNTIEFTPPTPVSPKSLGFSTDTRVLGVGFVSLKVQ
jgi:phosphoglycerol transferase